MFVRKLEKLEDKRFTRGTYGDGELFCVIGVFIPDYAGELVPHAPVWALSVRDPENLLTLEGVRVSDEDPVELRAREVLWGLLKSASGLSFIDLREVQNWNDSFEGSAEKRYEHVIRRARARRDGRDD